MKNFHTITRSILVVQDVIEGELIEIFVEADAGALALSILRRIAPLPAGDLPDRITENNVEIYLSVGVFEQDLTVDGNRVTLTAWRAQAVPRRTGRPSRGR